MSLAFALTMARTLATESVFQHQDARLAVRDTSSYCIYRLAFVRRSSEAFELSNYIADRRRRAKNKPWPSKIDIQTSITTQSLIPSKQLLYLLWCQSIQTVLMSSNKSSARSAGSPAGFLLANSSKKILHGTDLRSTSNPAGPVRNKSSTAAASVLDKPPGAKTNKPFNGPSNLKQSTISGLDAGKQPVQSRPSNSSSQPTKSGDRRAWSAISATPPRNSRTATSVAVSASKTSSPMGNRAGCDGKHDNLVSSPSKSVGKQARPRKTPKLATSPGKDATAKPGDDDLTMIDASPVDSSPKEDTTDQPDGALNCSDVEMKEKEDEDGKAASMDGTRKNVPAPQPPVVPTGVRFGENQFLDFETTSTPSGFTVTPMKQVRPTDSASQTAGPFEFDVSKDFDMGDHLFSVENLPNAEEVNIPSLQLGTKPLSSSEHGRFVSLRIVIPDNLAEGVSKQNYDNTVKKYVCEEIRDVLRALQVLDPTARFLHVYKDYTGPDSPYDDPNVVITWTVASNVLGFPGNPWVMRYPSKASKTKKSNGKRRGLKGKKRSTKENKNKGESTSATDDGESALPRPRALWITMRLKSKTEEEYLLTSVRSELTGDTGIFDKPCQELRTITEFAIIMAHHSLCLIAIKRILIECLLKQEEAMFTQQGINRKYFSQTRDADSGTIIHVQQPSPAIALRRREPPQIGRKKKATSDSDDHTASIILLDMSSSSLVRFRPVIAQLQANLAFQKQIGHKIDFLDVGPRLPKADNLKEVTTWKRRIDVNNGFNFMYDYKIIRGLCNPYSKVRVKMADKSQRSPIRTVNICRALTEYLVPWRNANGSLDRVPHLACQVCPILNSQNSDYGSTTIVYSGSSVERQIIFANLAATPIPWFYAFFTEELGYHSDMVCALLRRSFPGSENEIALADEDVTWNSESMTVTTVANMRQAQSLQEDMDEGLHLPISELIRSRQEVDAGTTRAQMFAGKGFRPEAELPSNQQGDDDAISYGTGVSHAASTVNSETTYSFNDNRRHKYAQNKLELAKSKATLADKDRQIADLMKRMEQMQQTQSDQRTAPSDDIDMESELPLESDLSDDDGVDSHQYGDASSSSASNSDESSSGVSHDDESLSTDDDVNFNDESSCESVTYLSTKQRQHSDSEESSDADEYEQISNSRRDKEPDSDSSSDDGSESHALK